MRLCVLWVCETWVLGMKAGAWVLRLVWVGGCELGGWGRWVLRKGVCVLLGSDAWVRAYQPGILSVLSLTLSLTSHYLWTCRG